jgi:hypothetical protein
MTIGLLFWILFIVGFVFHTYRNRDPFLDSLFWWVLIFLLGLASFGWPIRG